MPNVIGIISAIAGFIPLVNHIIDKVFDKKEDEKSKEVNEKIKQINEKLNEKNDKITELERKLLENKREEEIKKLAEINERNKIIERCKEFLQVEFSKNILEIENNFTKEEEKWLNSISDTIIQNKINILSKDIELLFDKLFLTEIIKQKINNKFIQILKNSLNKKELKKMNFMIIGSTGVGKSTLINELFEEKLAEEGNGTSCTKNKIRYESKKFPFLNLYDTVGTEVGNAHDLNDVENDTLEEITQKLNNNDPNEHIHCVLYCTTSNRFVRDELKVILKIRQKYDGKKLPIVIVYTRSSNYNDKNAEDVKNSIADFLDEYNESINDDIFGITFVKINSREEKIEIMGKELYFHCSGLSNLIDKCYKKGEKSYKIAIKNSLIQIGQNSLKEYVKNIYSNIVNNIDNFVYLNKEFDPDFYNYIAYCFEKIADIENQVGIELTLLQNNKNENNNDEQILCMFCYSPPKEAYICEICQAKVCEECYLSKFTNDEKVDCLICGSFNSFYPSQFKNKEENNILLNNFHLNNNLNIESKNLINFFIENLKSEVIEFENKKFEDFSKISAENIYNQLLEKYTKFKNDNNYNITNVIKSREEIISEATNLITQELKENVEKNYLKIVSSKLFKNIIEIFKNKMLFKIEEFINNLEKNDDVLNFFNSSEIFNSNKPLELKKKV